MTKSYYVHQDVDGSRKGINGWSNSKSGAESISRLLNQLRPSVPVDIIESDKAPWEHDKREE